MGRSDSREAGMVTVGDGTKGLVCRSGAAWVPWSKFVTGLRWGLFFDRQWMTRDC